MKIIHVTLRYTTKYNEYTCYAALYIIYMLQYTCYAALYNQRAPRSGVGRRDDRRSFRA